MLVLKIQNGYEDLKNDVEGITIKWLKENKIYYDKIVFDVKDKGKYCKENHINIMIEDDPINLRKLIDNTNKAKHTIKKLIMALPHLWFKLSKAFFFSSLRLIF